MIFSNLLMITSCQPNANTNNDRNEMWPQISAPIAPIKEHYRYIHGDTVLDNYYWLNDYFKKGPDSAEVIKYLTAENQYTQDMMAATTSFQDKLFQEMKSRMKEKDESVPYFHNGYYYYTKTEEGNQYYKLCRKRGDLNAAEEVLLDVDDMAKGKAYFSLGGYSVSPDNNLLLFGIDTVSRREYVLHVKNLNTGELLSDAIPRTTGSGVWAADNKTIFYTSKNPTTLLSEKIKKHLLGTDANKDIVVYNESDNTNYIGVSKSKNDAYIIIHSENTLSSEVRYLKATEPNGTFEVFQPRRKNIIYRVTPLDEKFLIHTNDEAQNFRVMECPLSQTARTNWKDLIPHRADVLVEGVDPFKEFIVISERKNGLNNLSIFHLKTQKKHYLNFGEPAYAVYPSTNAQYNTHKVRYRYTSMVTPPSTYEYDMISQEKTLLKQQEVLGGYNASNYVTERTFATATDGTKIPISLVYKKGTRKDGSAPLYLYAYGSYGNSLDATFNPARLSLLDRGFIYAIAHLRGGEEMGRFWYEDGKMMNKKNTFTDFIDCGKYLIAQKYTSEGHMYAEGGSAGGLLMGVIANTAPLLFNGIVAAVPFVDVVNTMLDETIPLTTNEYDEWGNPNYKEAYDYMKSYSPYENIVAQDYTNILVTTGLHDSQVQYFEPAKWVAKLRTLNTSQNVILLKTDMDFGHGGASGRFDYLKDLAFKYAFIFKLEGITQ